MSLVLSMAITIEDSSLHETVYKHQYAHFLVISTFMWLQKKWSCSKTCTLHSAEFELDHI